MHLHGPTPENSIQGELGKQSAVVLDYPTRVNVNFSVVDAAIYFYVLSNFQFESKSSCNITKPSITNTEGHFGASRKSSLSLDLDYM
jgi:hypothetical protein